MKKLSQIKALDWNLGNHLNWVILCFFVASCSVEKPGVKDMAKKSPSFVHTGKEADCKSCHEQKRPAMKSKFSHGNSQDCILCHKIEQRWENPRFDHAPVPEKCTVCHIMDRPERMIGKFSHTSEIGQGECAACHTAGAGNKWSRGTFNHNPVPIACTECHEAERPKKTVNGFDHSIDGKEDCVKCHTDPGQLWSKAAFFHSPDVNSCVRCHERNRPAAFTTPEETKLVGHFEKDDCSNCHQPKNDPIVEFVFKHTDFKKSKVEACLPCHQVDAKKNHENDVKVIREGFGNCFSCHKEKKSWSTD